MTRANHRISKHTALQRREMVEEIILNSKHEFYRTVDGWYLYVANKWVAGITCSPCRAVVRSVLFDMNSRGVMHCSLRKRGYFRQYRFGIRKAGENVRTV